MDSNADHGGTEDPLVEAVARGEFGQHEAVGVFARLDALDGLVLVRVELLARSFNPLQAHLGQRSPETPVDEIEALAELLVAGIAVGLQGALEIIQDGQDGLDGGSNGAVVFGGAVAFDPLAVIFEVGLEADQ